MYVDLAVEIFKYVNKKFTEKNSCHFVFSHKVSNYCRNFGLVLGFMRTFKTRVKEMGARNSAIFVVGLPSSDKLWDDVPNMKDQ